MATLEDRGFLDRSCLREVNKLDLRIGPTHAATGGADRNQKDKGGKKDHSNNYRCSWGTLRSCMHRGGDCAKAWCTNHCKIWWSCTKGAHLLMSNLIHCNINLWGVCDTVLMVLHLVPNKSIGGLSKCICPRQLISISDLFGKPAPQLVDCSG